MGILMDMDRLDIPRLRGVSHVYAFWFALVAALTLIVLVPAGTPRVAAAIYGAGLCALFGGSGLYHRWRWHPRWRPILRRVDHSTIFVFIAACYTPVGMTRPLGHDPLGGHGHRLGRRTPRCGAQRRLDHRPAGLCAACYVALGWVAVLAFPQMSAALPVAPIVLMAIGGVLYTVGAVIFALGRPNPWPRVFGFHEIFHVFVILAAVVALRRHGGLDRRARPRENARELRAWPAHLSSAAG